MRLFPPLRASWAQVGQQAVVPITGRNARRVLFCALNVCTGHRVVAHAQHAGGPEAQAFLGEIRRRYRHAPTIWLLLDRAPAHVDLRTQALAARLRIELVWLPKQWSELNAVDQLWRELKRLLAANRQPATIEEMAERCTRWIHGLTPHDVLLKAGVLSPRFWLRGVMHCFCGPT